MKNAETNGWNSGRNGLATRIVVIALAGLCLCIWLSFERLTANRHASNLKKAIDEERAMLSESAKTRDPAVHDALLSRMREHMESTASQMDGVNGAASRAMAGFAGKFQAKQREYDAALAQLRQEKVLSFQIRDRPTIERHRAILRAFLTANEQLADFRTNAEDLLRAELEKALVPSPVREQTLAGFVEPQMATRTITVRMRQDDQTTGEAGLAVLDLLDQNWGKWQFDESAMRLVSQDTATVTTYKALIQKLGAAQADKETAKQELAEKVNAGRRALDEAAQAASAR